MQETVPLSENLVISSVLCRDQDGTGMGATLLFDQTDPYAIEIVATPTRKGTGSVLPEGSSIKSFLFSRELLHDGLKMGDGNFVGLGDVKIKTYGKEGWAPRAYQTDIKFSPDDNKPLILTFNTESLAAFLKDTEKKVPFNSPSRGRAVKRFLHRPAR